MNRDIEFRVYDKDLKKMRYLNTSHDFICFDENGSGYYHNMQTGLGEWFSDLMQYTGLKDKNGKKIFEGDIVKVHYSYESYDSSSLGAYVAEADIQGVVSLTTPLGIYIDTGNEYQNYLWEYLYNYSLTEYPEQIEVIGNIYEDNLESEVN